MTPTYSFALGARIPSGLAPEIVAGELAKIESKHGSLKPAAVVASARPKRSPLHACFEWDDARAAEQHRLHQARILIAVVTVTFDGEGGATEPVRAFVHVGAADERRYVNISSALASMETRQMLVQRALREAEGWRQRHKNLHELSAVFAALDEVAA